MTVLNHFVKIACISLLLAFPKIAWSQDQSFKSDSVAAAPSTEEAAFELNVPGKNNLTVDITSTEEQLLDEYLEHTSEDKLLASLITAMQQQSAQVRTAALEVFKRILESYPQLAQAKTLKILERTLEQDSLGEQADERLLLLISLIESNPKLAPPVLKLVLKLTKRVAMQGKIIERAYTTTVTFPILLKRIIEEHPASVQTIIKEAQQDVKVPIEERNVAFRVQILRMLDSIVDTEPIHDNPKHTAAIANVALQNNRDYDKQVQKANISLFSSLIKAHPTYVQKVFESSLEATESKKAELRIAVLNTFELFVRADTTYIPAALEVADENTEDPIREVRRYNLALIGFIADAGIGYRPEAFRLIMKTLQQDQDDFLTNNMVLKMLEVLVRLEKGYASKALDSVVEVATKYESETIRLQAIKLLSGFVKADGQCVPKAFATAKQARENKNRVLRSHALMLCTTIVRADASYHQPIFQLGAKSAREDKDEQVRSNALWLLEAIAEVNAQLRPEVVNTLIQAFQDKESVVRKNALSGLIKLMQADAYYVSAVYPVAMQGMKDKKKEVRQEALQGLESILKADASYGQKQALKSLLQEASMDKDETVRNSAQALLKAYFTKSL